VAVNDITETATVLSALGEFDALRRDEFLAKYRSALREATS
jgi:hypothetical protein